MYSVSHSANNAITLVAVALRVSSRKTRYLSNHWVSARKISTQAHCYLVLSVCEIWKAIPVVNNEAAYLRQAANVAEISSGCRKSARVTFTET